MEQYILMALLPILGALWRRKDGSNRTDRWNISKGAWRVGMSIFVLSYCFKFFGVWGLWLGAMTSLSLVLGISFMISTDSWTSWGMWNRYALFASLGVIPLIYNDIISLSNAGNYVIACIFAGLSYPIGAKWFSDFKYTNVCEYIVGAVVIGGLAFIG